MIRGRIERGQTAKLGRRGLALSEMILTKQRSEGLVEATGKVNWSQLCKIMHFGLRIMSTMFFTKRRF